VTRRRALVALGGLAISAVFLWLAIRDADAGEVKAALENAEVGLVLFAVVAFGIGYFFQALRWRKIANTPRPRLRRFYGMVLGGLACNNVLPVRIGELLRAGWLSREAPMPGGRALGTVALDRVCDVVTLAAMLFIGIHGVPTPGWLQRIVVGAVLALVALAAALVFSRWYTRTRERERRTRGRVRRIVRDTLDMLGEPVGRRRAATWLGLSAVTWTLGTFATYLVARSVGIDLAPLDAVFVSSALALGVAIPSSPGYVGTYQWLGVASLGLLDVPASEALAFSILMQASWYVPTTIAGGAILGWRALRMR
jgi:glycosyltransferase 2 family protein